MIKPVGSYNTIREFLSELVKGKTVLDVGCVQHSAVNELTDTWLHKHICRSANRVVGLDYKYDDVIALNSLGYNIICADAMTVELDETFDVIIAGDIIEHIENPAIFLRNMNRYLNPAGKLVVTTPNVFFFRHFFESLYRSPYKTTNPEHVCWYCYFTLENLIKRCGMNAIECFYFTRSRKTLAILKTIRSRCPGFLASTLVLVASKSDRNN